MAEELQNQAQINFELKYGKEIMIIISFFILKVFIYSHIDLRLNWWIAILIKKFRGLSAFKEMLT